MELLIVLLSVVLIAIAAAVVVDTKRARDRAAEEEAGSGDAPEPGTGGPDGVPGRRAEVARYWGDSRGDPEGGDPHR